MPRKTQKQISDAVAADALRGGSQSGPMPPHPALATPAPPPIDYAAGNPDDGPNEGY